MHTVKVKRFSILVTMVFALLLLMAGAGIVFANASESAPVTISQDEQSLVGEDTTIYVSGLDGNDSNTGASSSSPVQSLGKVLELLGQTGGTAVVMTPIIVSSSIDFNPSQQIVLQRDTNLYNSTETDGSYSYGEILRITGGDVTLNISNTIFDGANLDLPGGATKFLITLRASNNVLNFGENCVIQNNRSWGISGVSGNITITTTDLTITNCSGGGGLLLYINPNTFSEISSVNLNLSGIKAISNSSTLSTAYGSLIQVRSNAKAKDTSSFTMSNCVFKDNEIVSTTEAYGGIRTLNYIIGFNEITVSNCEFTKNSTEGKGLDFVADNIQEVNFEYLKITDETSPNGLIFVVDITTLKYNNIIMTDCSGSNFFYCDVTQNIIVENIKITNCDDGYVFTSYNPNNTTSLNFKDIEIVNCNAYYFVTSFHTIFNNLSFDNLVINNCLFSPPNSSKLSCSNTFSMTNCSFSNNIVATYDGNSYLIPIGTDASEEPMSSVIIENCDFTNNDVGSVIEIYQPVSDFDMTNCNFSGNTTTKGVINTDKEITNLSIDECSFKNNTTQNNGSAISAVSNGTWNITNSQFANNHAQGSGGAIYAETMTDGNFKLNLDSCDFNYNIARSMISYTTKFAGGGGVCAFTTAVSATNCNFYANSCEKEEDKIRGGGLLGYTGTTYVDNCVFDSNYAYESGALFGGAYISGRQTLTNSVIRNNSGNYAIVNWMQIIDNCLVYGNKSSTYILTSIDEISNCEIYDNTAQNSIITSYNEDSSYINCKIYNNNTIKTFGSIIFCYGIIMQNCELEKNDSDNMIYLPNISNPMSFKLDNVKIINNTVWNSIVDTNTTNLDTTTIYINNSKISGNVSDGSMFDIDGTINNFSINNSDFSGNSFATVMILMRNGEISKVVNINDSNISGNVMQGNSKGLFDITSTSTYRGKINISNSAVYGNTDSAGAVVQVGENVDLVVINSKFFSNQGAKGGAISVGNNATLDVSGGIEFGNNYADYGSCVYVERGGKVNLTNLNLHNMSSNGGLLYTEQGGELNVINGTVYDNVATNGSVFYYDGAGVISGVTAYNNSALNGGVLYVGSTGSVILEDVNFYSNSATQSDGSGGNGGAVYTAGIVTLRSGNIGTSGGGNSATNGGGVYVADGGSFTMSYNRKYNLIEERVISSEIFGSVSYNTATYGGGVYIASGGSATINGEHKNAKQEDENSTINGATINNNTVTYHGAGVYVEYDATLTLLGGEIEQNILDGTDNSFEHKGTAIYNGGIVIIDGGKIANNKGVIPSSSGTWFIIGGIYCDSDSILEVNNAIFIGNSCHLGSCIYSHENSNVNVKATKFLSNSIGGSGSGDGSICCVRGGNLKFDECDFQKNGTHNLYSYEISHKNGYIEIVNSNYVGGISQSIIGANGYGKIIIENTDFNLDLCGRAGDENMLFRINNNDIDFIVKNCNFVSNENESEPNKILGIYIRRISNCIFEGSNFYGSKAGICFENNASVVKATIKDCSFTNVGCKIEGGNEYLSPITILNRNSQSEINILDCIFTNNKSVGVDGSIINVGESVTAKIIFGGDIEITNNETTLGALNLQKLDNITFKKGTKLIIKDNDGGNFVIPASSGSLLQGDLHPDSVVYIELPKDENGDILLQAGDLVIGGKSEDYLVTSSILNNFYVVDEGYSLKFSAEDNGLILVDESILSAESTIITNDRVVVFDNQPHSVEDSDIKVMYGSSEYTDYTTLYSLDGEEYSTQKPTFTEIGDYEIFYKITDNYDESRVFTGSLMLRIIGKRIYVTQAPSAQLRSRSALSRAIIYGGSVKDEDGNAVAGSWSFSEPSTVPTQSGSTYQVVFTPANAGLYDNSNTAVAMASVDILYDRVYYRNGIFVTDYDDPNNTLTGFSKLTDMVANLVEGGVIVFGETYYAEGTEEIVATKNLVIERYTSFGSGPMIVINQGANTLSFTGAGSEIIFDGRVSTSNVFTGNIFDNYGTLKLGSMVTIRNFVTKSASGSNAGVASTIYNRPGAELILAGCNITANLVKNGSNDFGGVIYNEGLLRIAGGRFSSNYQNTIESNTTRMGSGGFVYNAGEMIMSGGVLANNFAVYGGAIYADSGSTTRLTGGTIIDNYATTGGGVVYVAGDAVLLIGDLNIAGNYANNKWNIVEIEDQNSAIIYNQSTQSVMTGEELEALETLNVKATSNTPTNDNDSGLIVGLLAGCMVLGFVCIVFYKKSRTKRF